jgi:hypothetical protein
MKKLLITLTVLAACISAKAQILQPVHWSYAEKKISATEAVVFCKATIDEGWHIYSQNMEDGGPIKTSFKFSPSAEYTLDGVTAEPKPVVKFEKTFSMNVKYFEHEVIFQQRIKLKKSGPTVVKGSLEYMTCNDKQCLPPDDLDFSVTIQ